jgi:ABC-type branched-subunit amino acid transport system substrate-binding protein
VRGRSFVAVVAVVVVLTACGSGASKNRPTTATTKPVVAESTALGQGVTATDIKIGVMMIDFGCLKDVYDTVRPDQQQAYQIFFDDINAKGGVNGRKLTPVFESYCPPPLNPTQELAACTALTEDHHVFAVIGTFYDPTGNAQLCFTKKHHTIVIADSLTDVLAEKTPGMLLTPDIAPERRTNVIMSLLRRQRTLNGKKVGTISDSANRSRVTNVVEPALRDLGVRRGADATLAIASGDLTDAQSQLDSFIERWKGDGTNALVLVGDDVAAKQFVDRIKKALPNMLLVADTTSILDGGREDQKAGESPNPYDGAITAEGDTGLEHTHRPHFAYCRDIWEKATGRKVPSPNVVVKLPNGKQNDIYGEVEDGCLFVNFFATIAERVGPDLNNDNWVRTVDNFGPVDDTSTVYASLHKGKYDADDTYGLVAYDHTIGDAGDWRRITPVQDVGGG